MALALIFHTAAPAAYFLNAALDDQQTVFPVSDQNAGKPSRIVKGQLVQLWMLGGQFLNILLAARHLTVLQKGAVQMIFDAGMIKTVQIGKIQNFCALVAQNIHVIFQRNFVSGQSAGLIHTQDVHAAEALHGVDVFHHSLLFSHGCAALCQAGVNDHGKHFRCQTHGDRQRKQERGNPVPFCQAACNQNHWNQDRHKAYEHPRNGIGTLIKSILSGGFGRRKAAIDGVLSHSQDHALPAAASQGGTHENEVAVLGIGLGLSFGKRSGVLFQDFALSCNDRL